MLEGILIHQPGVYLPLEGAIEYLLDAAEEWEQNGNPSAALALREVAEAWQQVEQEQEEISLDVSSPETDPVLADLADRIEMYQDAEGRWHARTVVADGRVIGELGADFDQSNLEKLIRREWPHLDVYTVPDETYDSTWAGIGPARDSFRGKLNRLYEK